MQTDEFLGRVQHKAHLATLGKAMRATRATLETLAERLGPDETRHLAAQLPHEIQLFLADAGMPMPEQILVCDHVQRRFQYRITTPIFTHHRGTIDVIDLEDGTCLVVYSTEADPRTMAPTQAALAQASGGSVRLLVNLRISASAWPCESCSCSMTSIGIATDPPRAPRRSIGNNIRSSLRMWSSSSAASSLKVSARPDATDGLAACTRSTLRAASTSGGRSRRSAA